MVLISKHLKVLMKGRLFGYPALKRLPADKGRPGGASDSFKPQFLFDLDGTVDLAIQHSLARTET